jgi:site-specific recombinase XerD
MLQYSFDLDKFKPRKDGTFCLKAKIYRSRTDYIFISLKIYLLSPQWDGKKIVNTVTAAIDNARLNNYRVSIGKVLLDVDESGENISLSDVRKRIEIALGQKQQKPATFCAYCEAYANKVPEKGTRNNFFMTIKKVLEYDPVDRQFSAITVGWLRGFEMYYINKGLKINSLFMHLRNIRTIYNRAIDDGVAQLNDYPFRRFKIKHEATRKRSLTVEQLRMLRDYPCTESQKQYRDIFMLIFYLRGINIGDLFKLKNIENGYIYYSRSKTRKPYAVKVEPEALAIIEHYRGKNYLLAPADRYKNHEDFTRRINRALQAIGAQELPKVKKSKPGPAPIDKKNGLFPELTTYWARHSWATIAAGLDIPKETIAAGLGHSNNTTTDIYIAFDARKVDDANRKIIDYVNENPV